MPSLSADLREKIAGAARGGLSRAGAARVLGLDRGTVRKYWPGNGGPVASRATTPLPVADHEGPELPAAEAEGAGPVRVDWAGVWLILSDVHLPYHDRPTLELAVREARRRGVAGVLLNGDVLDSHEISDHDKDPGAPRYAREIEKGRQFLGWLRGQCPRARVIYREGNHEDRLPRYIERNAPALSGIDGVSLPAFLRLADYGVEWVADKRVVWLGKLPTLHGHEYRGGGGGVNPARWLYLRARYVAMCGHFHRTGFHHEGRNIRGKAEAAWSLGCTCQLSPRYMPLNGWNHGFALVEVAGDGSFVVDNKRVREGKIE